MTLDELTTWLDGSEDWDYERTDDGVLVKSRVFDTVTHCTHEAIAGNPLETIKAACTQGRDVDHVTRVTGYFSKVSGWNKGKTAELRDRHRSRI